LQLITKTIGASFDAGTQLLIGGVRGKIDAEGAITHPATLAALKQFAGAFMEKPTEKVPRQLPE